MTGWKRFSAIQRGTRTNRLELACSGTNITASINGTQVSAIQDETYQEGFFFAYIEVGDTSVSLEARFDEAVITER